MNQNPYIKPLTSFRFIFALMVFFHHLTYIGQQSQTLAWLKEKVFYEGYLGVSFFFILSGFIIAYNYENRLKKQEITRKEFFIARFARIYPMHFITLIAAIPLTILTLKDIGAPEFVKNLILQTTLTQSFASEYNTYFSFNWPSWSISNEMFFYVLFPFVFLRLLKNVKIIYITSIILVVATFVLMHIIDESQHHRLFYVNPVFRIVDFLIGVSIYGLRKSNFFNNFKTSVYHWLEALSILLFALFFLFHKDVSQVYRFSFYYWLPMAIIIFVFSYQKGFISRWLSNKTIILLGEASYSFYLIHHLVIRYFLMINYKIELVNNEWISILLLLSVSIIISIISYKIIEKPFNRKIRGLYQAFRK